MIQAGLRYCGIGYYGANDTDWNLLGTSGSRMWAKNITFATAFGSSPSVNTFVAGFHLLQGNPLKFHVGVTNVTTTGFQIQISTWDDSQIGGLSVGWLAFTN